MGEVADSLFKKGAVKRPPTKEEFLPWAPKQNPMLTILEPITWLQEAPSGAITYAARGRNPLEGAYQGMRKGMRPANILSELERQNILNPENAFIGSQGETGRVMRHVVDIAADPAWFLPYLGFTKFQALTKTGKAIKIAPEVASGLRAEGKATGLRALLRGEAGLTGEEVASLPSGLRKAYELVNRQALKAMERDGRLPSKLGETLAERVRLKQQRVAGFTGPKMAAAVESASSTLAKISSWPIIKPGVGATRKAVQNVFGRWLDENMRGMRDVNLLRESEVGMMMEESREKAVEMAALQKKINPDQLGKVTDFSQNVYALSRPKKVIVETTTGKGSKAVTTLEEVEAPAGSLVKFKTDNLPSQVVSELKYGAGQFDAELITQYGPAGKFSKSAKPFKITGADVDLKLALAAENPVMEHLEDLLSSAYKDQARIERAVGVLDLARDGYVPIQVNPKLFKVLDKPARRLARKSAAFGKTYSTFLANNKARTMGDISFDQINAFMHNAAESGNLLEHQAFTELFKEPSVIRALAKADPKGFGEFVLKNDLFVSNPTLQYLLRSTRHIKAVTNAKAIDRAVSHFAIPFEGKKAVPLFSARDRKEVEYFLTQNTDLSFYVPYKNYINVFDPNAHPFAAAIDRTGMVLLSPESITKLIEAGEDVNKLKGTTGFFLPTRVVDDLNKSYLAWSTPREVAAILRAYDGYQNWWKLLTLIPSPAFHIRNIATDISLAYLAGMGKGRGPERVASMLQNFHEGGSLMLAHFSEINPKLGEFLRTITRGVLGDTSILDKVYYTYAGGKLGTGRKIMRQALGAGIWRKGWTSDFLRSIEDQYALLKQLDLEAGSLSRSERAKRFLSFFIGQRNPLIKGMSSIASFSEGQIRLGAFLDQVKKGNNVLNATNWLKKHMYVASELSKFDRVTRRIYPFWQWKKFEIPAIFDVILTHPEIINAGRKAVLAFYEDIGPESEQARIKWIKNAYGIPVRKNKKTGQIEFFLAKYWIPGSGLLDLFRPATLVEELGPPFRPILEEVFNQDLFFGRKVSRDIRGETGYLGPLVIPEMRINKDIALSGTRIAHMIRNLLPARVFIDAFERIGGMRGERRPDPERGHGTPLEIIMKTLGLRLYGMDPDALAKEISRDVNRTQDEFIQEYTRLLRNEEFGRAKTLYEGRLRYLKDASEALKQATPKKK